MKNPACPGETRAAPPTPTDAAAAAAAVATSAGPEPNKDGARRTMIKLAVSTPLSAAATETWVDVSGGRSAIRSAAAHAIGVPVGAVDVSAGGHLLATPQGLAAALRTRRVTAIPRQAAGPVGHPAATAAAGMLLKPDDIAAVLGSLGPQLEAGAVKILDPATGADISVALGKAAEALVAGGTGEQKGAEAIEAIFGPAARQGTAAQTPAETPEFAGPIAPIPADAPAEVRRLFAEECDRREAAARARARTKSENIQTRRRIEALRDRKDARRAARNRKRKAARAEIPSENEVPQATGFAGFTAGFLTAKKAAPVAETAPQTPKKTGFAGFRAGFLN